ncbi:hypothetical protein BTS2_3524 [Bacillus sp. TS-2]|nr:hypothetical protein BTS2_3524 [Bacillus sp. TS-2]
MTWFNELELLNVLSFGTSGSFFFLVLIIYSLLGTITAFLAKKNNYRILLFIFSITLLIYSLIITYVGMFGFCEP